MTPYLLDVNVLLTLNWSDLQHYSKVKRWFVQTGQHSFATCSLTQAGFARISSSSRPLPNPATLPRALEILAELTQMPGHIFWLMDSPLREATAFCANKLSGPGQLTDAYLLGLAIAKGGTLVTLDRGILHLAGIAYAKHVLLL